MQVSLRQTGQTVVVGSAFVILMIILGTLQYSWIDQVSRVERDRRQTQLAESALRLSDDVDSELSRLQLFFLRPGLRSGDLDSSVRSSYEHWKADQIYGGLLKEVWRVSFGENDGREERLGRFQPDSGQFLDSEWPAHLSAVQERIEISRESFPFLAERGFHRFDGTGPAVIVPVVFGDGRGRRPRNPQLTLLILVLDADFIRDVFLPELAARHFGSGSGNEFRLWVRDRMNGTVHFKWPEADGHSIPERADVRQPIFVLRSQRDFSPGQRGRGWPSRGGLRARLTGPPRGPTPGSRGRESEWELLAVHRSGSLEAAVNEVKFRNLFVTTAVLLILASSILVTLLSAQKSRKLAQQQMDFVASVSHELRTPLTAIRSAAQNLRDGVVSDSAQVSDYGRIIGKAESRLSEMVMQVLDFARSNAAGPSEPLERIELASLVTNVVDDLFPSILGPSTKTEIRVAGDLPTVWASRDGLRRVLENLIQNAVKYSGKEARIEIAGKIRGRLVELSVLDHGPGIDQSDLGQVFKPFFRGKNVQATQIQGSGLGLSLVKRIVQSFGGTVGVESQLGKGTVFRVTLRKASGVVP